MVRDSTIASSQNGVTMPRWAQNVVSKGQTTEALVRRLKTLREHLEPASSLDIAILDHIREQIFTDELLTHTFREARTLVASCLAEMLRLYAIFESEDPFDSREMHKIFSFFAAILTSPKAGLCKSDGPLFTYCTALLETLIDAKCFALPSETDDGDAIIIEYFQKFFGVMKADMQKNIQVLCAKALVILVQYCSIIPKQAVQVLVSNFSIQVKRANRSAYQLAELVANGATAELQAPVAQHFADLLFKAVQISDDNERDEKLQEAHTLIVQINKACPALLLSVMPQLEQELRAADEKLRLIAVRTLGFVFADSSIGGADYFKRHASTWKAYLGRSNDKDARIRIAWLEALPGIVNHHHVIAAEVATFWKDKLEDADERVRTAAVGTFQKASLSVLRDPQLGDVLKTLRERVRDSRQAIRTEALNALGHVYELAYADLESGDASICETFGWIINALSESLLVGNEGVTGTLMKVQSVMRKSIIPMPDATTKKAGEEHQQRLTTALRLLDADNVPSFLRICNVGATRLPAANFIGLCKDFNGGEVEASQADGIRGNLFRYIRQLATSFDDQQRAAQDLQAFAKAIDARLYTLISKIIDETSPLVTISKAFNELVRRLRPSREAESRLANTIEGLVTAAGHFCVNTSSVPALYAIVGKKSDSSADANQKSNTEKLLSAIAASRPKMLKVHTAWLLDQACAGTETEATRVAALQGLAAISRSGDLDEQIFPEGDRLAVVRNSALKGTYLESKFAAKLLCLIAADMSNAGYAAAYEAAESMAGIDSSPGDVQYASKLASMTQLVKRLPDVAAPHVDEMTTFCVKNVLMAPFSLPDSLMDTYWLKEEEITPQLQDRLAALRFLTARCLHHRDEDTISAILDPTLRLLLTCLTDGEPTEGLYTGDAAKARIRKEAAVLLLKICRRNACDTKLATADFQRISTVLQDECFHVREAALHRLVKYAVRRKAKLPPRFYSLAFLVALDPEEDLRRTVRDNYAGLQKTMPPDYRLRYFEVGLSRLLHLLNHHPDFENAWVEDEIPLDMLTEASKYFDFYLECCGNANNFACLYHIAHRTKGMRDIADPNESGLMLEDGPATCGLHALCDLAMCLIKRRADVAGSIVGNYPGNVSLPRDLYVPYSTLEEQNKVYKKSYLNDEALEYFTQPMRKETHRPSKRKMLGEIKNNGMNGVKKTKKAKAAKPTKPARKRAPRYMEDDDENDEDDAASDGEESDEDANDSRSRSSMANGKGANGDIVSDDESVASAGRQNGGSARVQERQRKEKLARNAERKARRQQLAARSS